MNTAAITGVAARKTILLVDDNAANLAAGKAILKDQFKVYPVPSAEVMFDLLEDIMPDLILLDVEMPEMDGYEAIKRLKNSPVLWEIPIIFLTAFDDINHELEGLSLGAVDYVRKPFSGSLLIQRINNQLELVRQRQQLQMFNNNLQARVEARTKQLDHMQSALLNVIADLVEFRDINTGGHVTRTQSYMRLLLNEMIADGVYSSETKDWNLDVILPSSQLHDVGKIAISDLILNKPGKLDDAEFEKMKTHVIEGVHILLRVVDEVGESEFLQNALLIASSHHEKWDGSGYPNGVAGCDIPLQGRLMAIADVYDALVSSRPYKKPLTTEAAEKIILEGSGTHFDPELVRVFANISGEFAKAARTTLLQR